MRRVCGAIALILLAGSAAAQTGSLSEAQKRRLHVPYVKAATYCISSAVRNDPEFNTAAVREGGFGGPSFTIGSIRL
jgi:hypothetical protein